MMHDKAFYNQTTLPGFQVIQKELAELPNFIGPYKIESMLHTGGMSLLYLAKHPEKNELLAIKVLSPKYVAHLEMKQQFLKEAEIIALTDHPNIVKLHGQGEWEGGLYIAMEFIQGISLRQFIIQHSLSLRRSLDIILQVAYALLHLHTHGVIHRDLKPENIILTENGQIKVVDFGISQLRQPIHDIVPSQGIVGTPSYMSPEMRKSPSAVSYSSDIYSLGVIAYELIIGKLSFGNIQLSYLPKHIRAIIQKALASDVEDRYQDIVDLITDISSYLKNNLFQKERSEKDELKEVIETLSKSQKTLLPAYLPNWSDIELGLGKLTGSDMFGMFYDFVKLPDRKQIIMIAETVSKELDAIVYIAFLKGLIRMSLHEYISSTKPFDIISFIALINEKLCIDLVPAHFKFHLLMLDPSHNRFECISSGFHSLWHIASSNKEPRLIINENPLLGHASSSIFYEVKDSWEEGQQLFLHTFNDDSFNKIEKSKIEEYAKESIKENMFFSCQTASDNILKKMLLVTPHQVEKNQKIVLCIQRID
ncbi:MAG: protein kinase [Chlamydiales bacterium]|nr:protein kinase [Chlamydiales bacterium]